ncbi:hypothetical protein B9Z55_013489 [Caenorhabditis nigoni]|uniref:PUA domain-containing protein n=1 Tax=Caenorhabditis nigoni TaxID=1611254 RepID=A0A2G5U210_9PELO|nr:hypothetical protein B9Z55_013489 [Caenorhabditis nigoni]
MFKKFDEKEDVTGATQLKSSVQKGIRKKLIENYPYLEPHLEEILPKKENFKVDKGAIKFILNGSSIMCPGLTSPGAKLTPQVPKDTVVAVMAEGKEHALAIGLMSMSSEEIQSINKGNGIESLHYLNDGLWHLAEKPLN